ncbi:hypothetical protein ACFYUY_01425 [Kitasatospora sp. NPDC004745]|uniref:hypothetical protein n=1 Tax=Kitasatospora sp. NPDC004745 TaxID=3364019 RepID=UPI00369AC7E5
MSTMSLLHHGASTPVPLGRYLTTLHTDRGNHTSTNTITSPHTLGSLAAGLAALHRVPGNVVDLVITQR